MVKVYFKKELSTQNPEEEKIKNEKLTQTPEEEKKVEKQINNEKKTKNKEDSPHSSDWESVDENDEKKTLKEIIIKEELHDFKEKKIGEVVYILKNDYIDRDIVGKIENTSHDKEKKGYKKKNSSPSYLFVPNDKRIPQMFIKKMEDAPSELVESHSIKLEDCYFVGRFKEWPTYSFYPHVQIVRYLGLAGDIENECKALLLENKVYSEDFLEKTFEHLNQYGAKEWEIPFEEREKRFDLNKTLICTIDPLTARDLDDALSIEEVKPGVYEIGVHIADVSYFVKENDPVDEEARKRTTSVYLPHRVLPMLPGILCEKLCSLNPGVERLAFSIFFQMNENGDLLKDEPARIGKSIIKSCGKLSYEVAQLIIDGKINNFEEFPDTCKLQNGIDSQKLMKGIIKMNELAQKRREKRMKNGSLHFDKKKKRFQLNEENIPISFTIEEVHFLCIFIYKNFNKEKRS